MQVAQRISPPTSWRARSASGQRKIVLMRAITVLRRVEGGAGKVGQVAGAEGPVCAARHTAACGSDWLARPDLRLSTSLYRFRGPFILGSG